MDALSRACAIGACMWVVACEGGSTPPQPTGSEPTSSIQVSVVRVQANGEVAQVVARVSLVTSGYYAALSGGDALVFHDASGNARALEDDGLPSGGEYIGQIATTETALSLDLVRPSGIARTLPITLPTPFTLVAPASVSRGAGIDVTWDADAAFAMSVAASDGPCLPPGGWSRTFAVDPGVASLQGADFVATTQPCPLTFEAARADASGVAFQIRTITFDTTP
jgi:hypothetical protein